MKTPIHSRRALRRVLRAASRYSWFTEPFARAPTVRTTESLKSIERGFELFQTRIRMEIRFRPPNAANEPRAVAKG